MAHVARGALLLLALLQQDGPSPTAATSILEGCGAAPGHSALPALLADDSCAGADALPERACALTLAHRASGRAWVAVGGTAAVSSVARGGPAAVGALQLGEAAAGAGRSALRLQRGPPPAPSLFREDGGAVLPPPGHRHGPPQEAQTAQAAIILASICLGALLVLCGQGGTDNFSTGSKVAGLLMLYFGVNTGFSLYMKFVLSDVEVSEAAGIQGMPAAFLVTAIQQVECFVVFTLGILVLWPTPWRYRPRSLRSGRDGVTLLVFALAFAANIGLNNLSISLLAVSLNLTLRSCLPLVTYAVQFVLQQLPGTAHGTGLQQRVSRTEVLLMFLGVLFAAVATVAQEQGPDGVLQSGSSTTLGVAACSVSVLAAAFYLVLAGVLGSRVKLNPLDISVYMSLPSAAFLVPPVFLLPHPAGWPGSESLTDWQVLRRVWELSPGTLSKVLVSGILCVGYNWLQFVLVQELSPTHTAFAGNVNKAATIGMSILLGVEVLPPGPWSYVMLLALVGNIACFTGFTVVQASSDPECCLACLALDASPHVKQKDLCEASFSMGHTPQCRRAA